MPTSTASMHTFSLRYRHVARSSERPPICSFPALPRPPAFTDPVPCESVPGEKAPSTCSYASPRDPARWLHRQGQSLSGTLAASPLPPAGHILKSALRLPSGTASASSQHADLVFEADTRRKGLSFRRSASLSTLPRPPAAVPPSTVNTVEMHAMGAGAERVQLRCAKKSSLLTSWTVGLACVRTVGGRALPGWWQDKVRKGVTCRDDRRKQTY